MCAFAACDAFHVYLFVSNVRIGQPTLGRLGGVRESGGYLVPAFHVPTSTSVKHIRSFEVICRAILDRDTCVA
jgi:hypothetical protein